MAKVRDWAGVIRGVVGGVQGLGVGLSVWIQALHREVPTRQSYTLGQTS